MKEEQFIKVNSNTWRELEDFSIIINKKGVKNLSSEDVVKFLRSFRYCSNNLAYATTHYPKSDIVSYLNSLVSKCHNHIYAVKKISPSYLIKYITYDFPMF